ncbi:hypothetical protein TcCL_Unassigned02237, partial [Trypanosoma cruzi]
MEEGEENRSGTQGSIACTCGESGPSCRHPSRRVRTHNKVQRTQQHKSKVTIQKGDPGTPRGLLFHGKCSQYSPQAVQLQWAFVHIHRTQFHAGPATTATGAAARATRNKKGGGVGDYGAAVTAAMRSCVYVVSGGGDVPLEPL